MKKAVVLLSLLGACAPVATTPPLATGPRWTAYPNPARNRLYIRFEAGSTQARITLTDALGRIIFTDTQDHEAHSEFEIPVAGFARGVYFLQCTGAEGMESMVVELGE
jgi:Secretion system C-terminal sorting domain